jgi:hypothetical protein
MMATECKNDSDNPPYTTDQLQPYHSEELLGSQIIRNLIDLYISIIMNVFYFRNKLSTSSCDHCCK